MGKLGLINDMETGTQTGRLGIDNGMPKKSKLGLIDDLPSSDIRLGKAGIKAVGYKPVTEMRPLSIAKETMRSAGEEFKKLGKTAYTGLAKGVTEIEKSLGTGIKAMGAATGSKRISDLGETVTGYWKDIGEKYEPPKEIQGDVVSKPTLLKDPSWWTYNVFESVPGMAVSMIPGMAAGKYIKLGGESLRFTPRLVKALSRAGSAITGGAIGGGLEGAQTYEKVKEAGGTDEEALQAASEMSAVSAALNAISLDTMLGKTGSKSVLGIVKKLGVSAITEAGTEAAEEPAEAVIRKQILGERIPQTYSELLKESAKDAATVAPIAGITGMAGGGAGLILDSKLRREIPPFEPEITPEPQTIKEPQPEQQPRDLFEEAGITGIPRTEIDVGKSERDIAKAKTIQDEMSHPDYNKYGDVKELYYGRVYDMRFANPDDITNINKDIAKNYKELGLDKDSNTDNPRVMMRVLDRRVGDYAGVIGSDGKYYPSELMFGRESIEEPKGVIERGQGQGYGQAEAGQVAPTETRVSPEVQSEITALQPEAPPAMAAAPPVTTSAIKESLTTEPATAPITGLKEPGSRPAKWLETTGTTKTVLNKEERELLREAEATTPEILNEVRAELSKPNIVQEIKTKVASQIKIDQSLRDSFPAEEYNSLLKSAPNLFSNEKGISFDEVADGLGITTDELAEKLKDFKNKQDKLDSAKQMIEDYKSSQLKPDMVNVGELNLKVGTEFKINGEKYKVIHRDENGDFVIKDGDTYTVDEFNSIPMPDEGSIKQPSSKIKQAKFEYDKTKVDIHPKMESSLTVPALQKGQKGFFEKAGITPLGEKKIAQPPLSEAEILIRESTPKEEKTIKGRREALNNIPEKEGYKIAYKPYGEQGRGFYYIKEKESLKEKLKDTTGAIGNLKSGFFDRAEIAIRNKQVDMAIPMKWLKQYAKEILGISKLPDDTSAAWHKINSEISNRSGYDTLGGMTTEEVNKHRMEGKYTGWQLTKELHAGIPVLEIVKSLAKIPGIEQIVKFHDPLKGLSESAKERYLSYRSTLKGKEARIDKFVNNLVDRLRELPTEIRTKMFHALTSRESLTILPKEYHRLAESLRSLNKRLGAMAVKRDLLSAETYEYKKGEWVKTIYEKYIKEKKASLSRQQSKTTMQLDWKKPMMSDTISGIEEQRERGLIEDVSISIPVGTKEVATDLARADFFNEISNDDELVWKPSFVYVVEGVPITNAEYQGLENKRGVQRWSIGTLQSHVELQEKAVARQPDNMALRKGLERLNGIMDVAKKESGKIPGNEYVKLPDSIAYGSLKGAYVKTAVARDIMPILSSFGEGAVESKFLNAVRNVSMKAMAGFKASKVALNIPSWFRNGGANTILFNMKGTPLYEIPVWLAKSAKQIINESEEYTTAFRQGLFRSKYSDIEINNLLGISNKLLGKDYTGFIEILKGATSLYGKIDDWFKFAIYLEERGKGNSVDTAIKQANKWGLDYSLAHPAVKAARQSLVPFATFSYKFAPLFAETMLERPMVLAKYMAIPYIMLEAVKHTYDLDDDDAKKLFLNLPSYVRKNKTLLVLPKKTPEGDWQWVDIGYFMPWSNYMQLYNAVEDVNPGGAMQALGIGNPFLDVYSAIKSGRTDVSPRDPFSGKEIYNQLDDWHTKLFKVLEWQYNTYAPSMATRRGAAGYMVSVGEKDQYGRTITPEQAIGRLFGLNIIAPTEKQAIIETRAKLSALQSDYYKGVKEAQEDIDEIRRLQRTYEIKRQKIINKED